MVIIVKDLTAIYFATLWFTGIALAQGWWTLLAAVFPPYGFYKTAEWLVKLANGLANVS